MCVNCLDIGWTWDRKFGWVCCAECNDNAKKPKPPDIWKYRNPDRRCNYPFDPSPLGYCWSFASYIDGGEKWLKQRSDIEKKEFKTMEDICRGCDRWNEKV